MLKKALKMIALIFTGLIIIILITGTLFIKLNSEFGSKASKDQKTIYANSKNFKNGKFVNFKDIDMSLKFTEYFSLTIKFFSKQPNSIPDFKIPVEELDSVSLANYSDKKPRIIWFGHSTFLMQIGNKNIIIDPMFGNVPAPHPKFGTSRFNKKLPIEIGKLPQIDAIIISHDHYDHLDYGSILKLKNKTKAFFTPLGVGNHLIKWGIDKNIINELDWWEETMLDSLRFICTPAQHFSGRGLSDRDATLWCSWIIQTEENNIYYSGDTGYEKHFKEIGDKYGPFDFAMLECGQYNELWIDIHMLPEQTKQAAMDLNTKKYMPMHWGSFKLALHPWTDSVEKLTEKTSEISKNIIIPKIGEIINLHSLENYQVTKWWIEP